MSQVKSGYTSIVIEACSAPRQNSLSGAATGVSDVSSLLQIIAAMASRVIVISPTLTKYFLVNIFWLASLPYSALVNQAGYSFYALATGREAKALKSASVGTTVIVGVGVDVVVGSGVRMGVGKEMTG